MKKILLVLICLCLFSSYTSAEFDIKLAIPDSRISEKKMYLKVKRQEGPPEFISCYLPKNEFPKETSWELYYENEEVLRKAIEISYHNNDGTKISIIGREIWTIKGRGMLISSIKSNW